jgi:hypothetical protein
LFLAQIVLFVFELDFSMFKVFGLIFVGILLAASGIFFLSTVGLPVIHFPYVNWANVGFVLIIGSAVTFGTAAIASRVN